MSEIRLSSNFHGGIWSCDYHILYTHRIRCEVQRLNPGKIWRKLGVLSALLYQRTPLAVYEQGLG